MEGFEGELEKYKGTIQYLQRENAQLTTAVQENSENRMDTRMKAAALESRVRDLEHFKATVPEDVRKQTTRNAQRPQPRLFTLGRAL